MRGGPRYSDFWTWPCANERRMSRARRVQVFQKAWKVNPHNAVAWSEPLQTASRAGRPHGLAHYWVPPCGLWLAMVDVTDDAWAANRNRAPELAGWAYRVFTRSGYTDINEQFGAPDQLYKAVLLALREGYAMRSCAAASRRIAECAARVRAQQELAAVE